jgi:hypothetical protein
MDWCHDMRFWRGLQQDQVSARPITSWTSSCGISSDVLTVIITLSVLRERVAELQRLLLVAVTLLLLEAQELQVDCTPNLRRRASFTLALKSISTI